MDLGYQSILVPAKVKDITAAHFVAAGEDLPYVYQICPTSLSSDSEPVISRAFRFRISLNKLAYDVSSLYLQISFSVLGVNAILPKWEESYKQEYHFGSSFVVMGIRVSRRDRDKTRDGVRSSSALPEDHWLEELPVVGAESV